MKVNSFTRLLLLLLTVLSVQLVSAQASLRTWDFEEPCAQPGLAFQTGCIPFASAGSGTPAVSSVGGAASGSKYAQMNGCYPTGDGNNYAESILLNYNFVSGRSYTISFAYRTFDAAGFFSAPSMPLYLVNNISSPVIQPGMPQDACGNSNSITPSVPSTSKRVGVLIDYIPSGWKTATYEVVADANYNQLWFRPQGDDLLNNTVYDFQIDKVTIRETCDPLRFSVNLCQYPGSDELTATITGVNIPQGQWRMWKALNCNGGTLTPNFGAFAPINWTGPNTFSLPDNSGCYILLYIPTCGLPTARAMINTNAADIPRCDGICDDWSIVVTEDPCSTVLFEVESRTPLPSGTVITATMHNEPVEQIHPGIVEYDVYFMGDNEWVRVCFTVEQPNCPAITKCESYFVGDCDGKIHLQGSPSGTDALEEIRVTNPSADEIRFSTAIESGTAQLLNLQGQVVKTFTLDWTEALPVHELPAGGYVLHIQTANAQVAKLVTLVR